MDENFGESFFNELSKKADAQNNKDKNDLTKLFAYFAKHQKIKYEALIKAEFTEEQALKLTATCLFPSIYGPGKNTPGTE